MRVSITSWLRFCLYFCFIFVVVRDVVLEMKTISHLMFCQNHCRGMARDSDRFEGVGKGNPAAMVEDGQDGYRRLQVERSWRLSATLRTTVESVHRALHA